MIKYLWAIVALVIVVLGIIIFKSCSHSEKVEPPTKVEVLQSQIDSITNVKDSIRERIDTIYIKLETNNKQYEKDVNRVLNNDVNEDMRFFLDYINANRARLDSISSSLSY